MSTLSILLLSWNHERFIEQCIQSICSQTYANIEVVYLDNQSSDKTFEKGVALLKKSGLPFKSFQNSQSKKVSENFNFLLGRASGKYIMPLSTDDWLAPECVEEIIRHYEGRPDLGMLYNSGWIYYEQEKRTERAGAANFKRGRIYKELLLEHSVLFFIGCCYRREVFEKVGAWDESLLIEDMDMFIRIAMQYDIDYINKPLAYYRKMSSSATGNIPFMVKGWEQYYEKYKGVTWCNMEAWLSEKYRAYAAMALDRGQKGTAFKLLLKSLSMREGSLKTLKTFGYLLRRLLYIQ